MSKYRFPAWVAIAAATALSACTTPPAQAPAAPAPAQPGGVTTPAQPSDTAPVAPTDVIPGAPTGVTPDNPADVPAATQPTSEAPVGGGGGGTFTDENGKEWNAKGMDGSTDAEEEDQPS